MCVIAPATREDRFSVVFQLPRRTNAVQFEVNLKINNMIQYVQQSLILKFNEVRSAAELGFKRLGRAPWLKVQRHGDQSVRRSHGKDLKEN